MAGSAFPSARKPFWQAEQNHLVCPSGTFFWFGTRLRLRTVAGEGVLPLAAFGFGSFVGFSGREPSGDQKRQPLQAVPPHAIR